MATVVYTFSYGTSTWQIPSDCNGTITVDCIGPGGSAGTGYNQQSYGAGGGAWTRSTLTVTSGQVVYMGWSGKTWLNISSNAAPTSTAQGVLADGGTAQIGGGARGGLASNCIPSTGAYSGGSAASGYGGNPCGGAAGPSGAGGNGNASTGVGGAPNGGVGGGAGGEYGRSGTASGIYLDYLGNYYGPAGGSGQGSTDFSGKSSTWYSVASASFAGAGGTGGGTNGLIVVTYTSQTTPQGRYVVPIDKIGTSTWRVPDGVTDIRIEALGPGRSCYSYIGNEFDGLGYASNTTNYSTISSYPNIFGVVLYASIGGGGGAYALNTLKVTPGSVLYMNIPSTSTGTNNKTWLNKTNAIPTSLSQGVLAAGAGIGGQLTYVGQGAAGYGGGIFSMFLSYSQGGQAKDCIGLTTYSGGSGGNNYNLAASNYTASYKMGNAGGGGCAGPNGPGADGGNGCYISTSTGNGTGDAARNGGSGGGGGANGGTAGITSTTINGGQGGASRTGQSGGAGGITAGAGTTTAAVAGTNGSGGGGGVYYYSGSTYQKAGDGSTDVIPSWNTGSTTYGPGSGSGGQGRSYFYTVNSYLTLLTTQNNYNLPAAAPGKYGGGQGSGSSGSGTTGGQGLIVIQYTVTKNPKYQMFI